MGTTRPRTPAREKLLDAAGRLILTSGWQRLRVSHVAAEAGVSRQSAYNEFGSKEALGEALVMREFERHLDGLTEPLVDRRDDVGAAVEEAVLFTFRSASANPVLKSLLTSARAGLLMGELAEVVRNRDVPPLPHAIAAVSALVARHRPDLDQGDVNLTIDMVLRVTVSYLVTPEGTHEEAARRIAIMATRVLGVPLR
ncbi:TetR family transcriptional regulator [Actinocorallia sp. API 0066]|uniref:TetR family transcriptional regulator n=1 Tax=Actinocorallia sp. API 0066 TaxID=2896846 RepID=UPI001E5D0260|nr:TetR family transcriptional regulator [Actinocorallia sp. API 0066]MCD0448969.1 TetR family transcriptional regulator [Actinocorallia sp. API 0066]